MTVFADASYWIALLNERDAHHDLAVLLRDDLRGRPMVTSELVMVEVLNFFAGLGPVKRRAAVNLLLDLRTDNSVNIIEQIPQRFWNAVAYYNARPDQQWGLVDCVSFQIMEHMGIREALTSDRHFTQAGFTILM